MLQVLVLRAGTLTRAVVGGAERWGVTWSAEGRESGGNVVGRGCVGGRGGRRA